LTKWILWRNIRSCAWKLLETRSGKHQRVVSSETTRRDYFFILWYLYRGINIQCIFQLCYVLYSFKLRFRRTILNRMNSPMILMLRCLSYIARWSGNRSLKVWTWLIIRWGKCNLVSFENWRALHIASCLWFDRFLVAINNSSWLYSD